MHRIALSGAGGSGKGTLGKLLSDKYGFVFLPSPGESIGKQLGMTSYKDADDMLGHALQHSFLFGIIHQELGASLADHDFISERSSLDCIPYYLRRNLKKISDYEKIAIEHAKSYDHVFFLSIDFDPADKTAATWKERSQTDRDLTDRLLRSIVVSSIAPEKVTILSGPLENRLLQASIVMDKLLRTERLAG